MDRSDKKIKEEVVHRFLSYVKIDTQSDEDSGTHPSSQKQLDLARFLCRELEEMGFVRKDDLQAFPDAGPAYFFDEEHGYIYGRLPGNCASPEPAALAPDAAFTATVSASISAATAPGAGEPEAPSSPTPKIGFIAHMDTSPEASGKDVRPKIIENYDGNDILLSEGIILSPEDFPELKEYTGQTLITSDGTTLLGADDKSGIAEILTMVHHFIENPEEQHGPICIAFTPDEEIGKGTAFFDLRMFGADHAYTVDGGRLGELSYENFNAASARIRISGRNVHPGEAYGKMIHAARLAMQIEDRLPPNERPEKTRDHEGFYHLTDMKGDPSEAAMTYILRDHDAARFQEKKEKIQEVCKDVEEENPGAKIEVSVSDTYFNMIDKIRPHFEIVERAAEAMKRQGVTPRIEPVRGGTDGATLSYRGLLCPNLCAGGHNFHGIYEYVSCESMAKITQILISIANGR